MRVKRAAALASLYCIPVPCPTPQVLLTYKGQDIATLDVESRWTPNKVRTNSAAFE